MTVSQWPHMTISGQSKRSWTLLVGGNVPTVPVYWCRWVTNLPPWFYDIYPSIYLSIWLSHPLGREGLPHPTHRTRSANRESGFTVCYSGGFTKRLWHRDGFGVWKLRASGNLEVSRVSWTVREWCPRGRRRPGLFTVCVHSLLRSRAYKLNLVSNFHHVFSAFGVLSRRCSWRSFGSKLTVMSYEGRC